LQDRDTLSHGDTTRCSYDQTVNGKELVSEVIACGYFSGKCTKQKYVKAVSCQKKRPHARIGNVYRNLYVGPTYFLKLVSLKGTRLKAHCPDVCRSKIAFAM